MVHCDNCDSDVPEVWRRRERTAAMTHHDASWVCRECHPSIPGTRADADADNGATAGRAIADGGTMTTGCPICGGVTVCGQGLLDCRECGWSGPA